MNKISELFGLNCDVEGQNFELALREQKCPYTGKICIKMRKSSSDIKIGTCSVKYQNENMIICPNRLLEHNQIFMDCLHLLTLHEPGNELYLIPEVQIPGGHVDYFLVSAKNGKIMDFVGIELQTLDTTGTVWSDRQKFLHNQGLSVAHSDLNTKKTFGMNWKMTLKTILVQMHHKCETFENLNKHFVLVVQSPLFNHMQKDFDFSSINGARLGDPVHIHSYSFGYMGNRLCLALETRVSTDSAGIAKCLGLNADAKIGLDEIINILEPKLTEWNRLNIRVNV